MSIVNKDALDDIYEKYNRREFVHPDPLECLYRYDDPTDREIAGLVASGLAYGRVEQILKSVNWVLDRMHSPSDFLSSATLRSLREMFQGFRHRFTTGRALAEMLWGAKRIIEQHGSLQACFCGGLREEHGTVLPALSVFVVQLTNRPEREHHWLVASPVKGSACKRWHLFLRWLVRCDAVDPGGWDMVPASKLVVPLDVHMHRIGLALGMTERKQADARTAAEITASFRAIVPQDPVRYDFALTRFGIRREENLQGLLNHLDEARAS